MSYSGLFHLLGLTGRRGKTMSTVSPPPDELPAPRVARGPLLLEVSYPCPHCGLDCYVVVSRQRSGAVDGVRVGPVWESAGVASRNNTTSVKSSSAACAPAPSGSVIDMQLPFPQWKDQE